MSLVTVSKYVVQAMNWLCHHKTVLDIHPFPLKSTLITSVDGWELKIGMETILTVIESRKNVRMYVIL